MVGYARGLRTPTSTSARSSAPAPPAPTPPPDGLARVTRLGHSLLCRPVQVVAVSRSTAGLLAATPSDADAVPLDVARRIAMAEGPVSVEDLSGRWWFGSAVGASDAGVRVTICVPANEVPASPHTGRAGPPDDERAVLVDLAALAGDVLRLDAAHEDAADLRELLGTVSHDLRTPLSVLRAGLETLWLHEEELPPGQADRIAELAVRQARRMTGMIDGLLSLHGLEDDDGREDVDLRDLVRDAVEAGRVGHETVEFHLDLPPPHTPTVVRGLTDALARVLTNLVTNAAVHGGGQVWVELATPTSDPDADAGSDAVVTVGDDGSGMPEDSPLATGRRARRSGGHGLGLVISRRIVAGHRGEVSHRPRPGGGTVVEVRLPLRR